MAEIKPFTDEDQQNLMPIISQRKEEIQWAGWYTESVGKKKSEQRVCVVGLYRIFFFVVSKGAKLVRDFHILELEAIESPNPTEMDLAFRGATVSLKDCACDECITTIAQSFENNFFAMPKSKRFRLNVQPESRIKSVEGPTQASLAKSCGGFSGTYSALCDLYRIPIRADICWDMDNLLPANHVKEFNMKEFEQPVSPGDFKALIDTLHFNGYFTSFIANDYKLDKDAMKVLSEMLTTNDKIEKLVLSSNDTQSSGFEQVGQAIAKNKKTALTSIDWSFNSVQDKGIAALATAVGAMSHGIALMNLERADFTKKGAVPLFTALRGNPNMGRSLHTLNLAYNRIDNDGSSALAAFLSTPNVIKTLNLNGTQANLEVIFSALIRGCSELQYLNVTGNKLLPKAGPVVKNYLQASSKLQHILLGDTAVPVNVARDVLKAIGSNKYLVNVVLDLSGNRLGVLGANMIAGIAEEIDNIESLDLNNNELGDDGLLILAQGLRKNASLKELKIADNFSKGRTKGRAQTIDNLVELVSSDCPVERLDLSASRTDFEIRTDMVPFIYALATNDTLKHLDVSGHTMGDKGGIALGKALQTNRALESLVWDRNSTKLPGFNAFKVGLERNTVLVSMAVPIFDIAEALKTSQAVDTPKIPALINQISEAIARNQSPKSKFSLEGFSQNISFMGAGEREEINKLRFRIKALGSEPTADQQKLLKDSEENDDNISGLFAVQEEVQQALEDELASRLGQFAGQLLPFIEDTHGQLVDRVVASIDGKYSSLDRDVTGKLRADLRAGTKETITREALSKILAKAAASQISNEVSKSMVRSVELAADCVFDQLLDKLEAVYYGMKGMQPQHDADSASSSSSSSSTPRTSIDSARGGEEDENGDSSDDVQQHQQPSGPVVGGVMLPPGAKRLPPALPPKGGRGAPPPVPAKAGKPAPPPKNRKPPPATPPKGSRGSVGGGGGEPPQVASNIKSHLTKDRPMGPASRRRPQRKPARRPMMSDEASSSS